MYSIPRLFRCIAAMNKSGDPVSQISENTILFNSPNSKITMQNTQNPLQTAPFWNFLNYAKGKPPDWFHRILQNAVEPIRTLHSHRPFHLLYSPPIGPRHPANLGWWRYIVLILILLKSLHLLEHLASPVHIMDREGTVHVQPTTMQSLS
jgi:hypothetical protein